jgi:hypothetical protein
MTISFKTPEGSRYNSRGCKPPERRKYKNQLNKKVELKV